MRIGGLEPLTLLDFPDRVACIVFTIGCNLRCGYCHNPHLVLQKYRREKEDMSEEKFFAFLDSRQGLLDGVVISGGEPTIQRDLIDFIRRIKERGFLVKLDTNGTNPEVIGGLLEEKLIDYIAMDVKHVPAKYEKACGRNVATSDIEESVQRIIASGIEHEFRTTVVPSLHTEEDVRRIAQFCKGCRKYTIQAFRPRTPLLDPRFEKLRTFSDAELQKFKKAAEEYLSNVQVIG
jgi:pyruvate formate lyase activating enzyme